MSFLEKLAALEHNQWIYWTKELKRMEPRISEDRLKRWEASWVDYIQLPGEVKESDRKFAREVLNLIRANPKDVLDLFDKVDIIGKQGYFLENEKDLLEKKRVITFDYIKYLLKNVTILSIFIDIFVVIMCVIGFIACIYYRLPMGIAILFQMALLLDLVSVLMGILNSNTLMHSTMATTFNFENKSKVNSMSKYILLFNVSSISLLLIGMLKITSFFCK